MHLLYFLSDYIFSSILYNLILIPQNYIYYPFRVLKMLNKLIHINIISVGDVFTWKYHKNRSTFWPFFHSL